jgi:superfamily I DNA and/or RNA helicase/very-short-patch-repair endonuclease
MELHHLSSLPYPMTEFILLRSLKTARDTLNQYNAELHTPCLPLGYSIYAVNGKIAKLYNTPDIIFHLDKVSETSPEKLNQYRHLLENFSSTVGKMSEDYIANPWRSCHVQIVSHELRHDIETNLRHLTPELKNLSDYAYQCISDLGIDMKLSIHYTEELISILDVVSLSPKVPISWVFQDDIAVLSTWAEKFKNLKIEYKALFGELSLNYIDGFLTLDAKEVLLKFKTSLNASRRMLNLSKYTNDEEIATSAQNIISSMTICLSGIETLQAASKNSVELFGIKAFQHINDAILFTDFLEYVIKKPKPTLGWFDKEKFNILKRLFKEAKSKYGEFETEKQNVLSEYETEILDLDYLPMLKRFKVEYSSLLKVFKKSYWVDRSTIKSLMKSEGKKVDDNTIIAVLNHLKAIADIKRWLAENDELIIALFGGHYIKEYTDWADFEKAIDNFEKILGYFDLIGMSPKTRDILLSTEVGTQELRLYEDLKQLWSQGLHTIVDQILDFAGNANIIDFFTFTVGLKNVLSKLGDLSIEYQKMMQFCTPENNFDSALGNLAKLGRLQDIAQEIEVEHENLQLSYEFLFNGIETDWEQILNALVWTSEFKKLNTKHNFTESFIKKICQDEASINYSKIAFGEIKQKLGSFQTKWNWYVSLFDDKHELINTELHELLVRLEASLANLSALEEWIDYRISREQCRENGLTEYIEQIEALKIDNRLILPSFLKRFYRLWLDAVTPGYPAVSSFRRRTQDALVKQFSQLDKNQLSIARARVRHRLVSRLPDFNNKFTSAVDEVGILKRELSKQRKIMPLRKLFRAIPNLLVTLKPCLMMSPLSVSLFLEDENYNFDIVIFDEASQICTEDSIGAIMRGSQVVIAGDSKQLPPTNFFAASTSDNDFDATDEEEYDDTDAFQSILDESVTVLAERTLRWHYRSRHEHLIAFSNAKVYKNNLITFPSNIERVPDNGVEYIHVPTGIYDRSGKRINVIEAQKVAEIVFEHIKEFPERSLGVVTFSEAQCEAVEVAIRQLRLLNLRYEKFFSEDKEESFFVKNLERVQGDERDTIIFSIGYAKDQNGVMYMNFGPLSKDGGYRRLNVAITRAKYNVKLVGSILPTDLNTENITAEGVKMLRSYIEFAINGPSVLYSELSVSETISVESPFEESVYEFLVGKGYKVATQVGCSGYRIDMAVKHPTLNGIFVLGVECDGATYHSARTARERDRLRQSILEDIGWKIYRIWSTDWIKDPVTEGQKLLDVVSKAISAYEGTYHGVKKKYYDDDQFIGNSSVSLEVPITSTPKSISDSSNPYGFLFYEEANIRKVSGNKNSQSVYQSNVIKYVVEVEYPIHIELLCKRVAGIFGFQRVTAGVRSSVRSVIKRQLKDQVELIKDFCWAKGNNNIHARIPNGIEIGRKIDHICVEEIAEAMFVVASKSVGIMQDDLLVVTARVFGFNRTGGNIIQSMQEACDYLLESDKVKNFSGKIIAN